MAATEKQQIALAKARAAKEAAKAEVEKVIEKAEITEQEFIKYIEQTSEKLWNDGVTIVEAYYPDIEARVHSTIISGIRLVAGKLGYKTDKGEKVEL